MVRHGAGFILGMLAGAGLLTLGQSIAGWNARVWAAPQPAGSAKYTSKVVLENARVRVKDVSIPARGADPGMHTHEFPHVGVILTQGTLVFTEPGKPTETVKFDVGSVGFRETNVTHQVTNPGQAAMRVIEVELK